MPSEREVKAKRTRRTHSYGGCGTCRRRHVKCDRSQPICLTCQSAGSICDGYDINLKWISSNKGPASSCNADIPTSKEATRRHLYSEYARVSMSAALLQGLASKSVDESLSDLDTMSKDVLSEASKSLFIGPFGVMDLDEQHRMPPTPTPSVALTLEDNTVGLPSEEPLLVDNTSLYSSSPYQLLDWSDLFEMDLAWPQIELGDIDGASSEQYYALSPRHDTAVGIPSDLNPPHQDPSTIGGRPQVLDPDSATPWTSMNPPLTLRAFNTSDAQTLLSTFTEKTVHKICVCPLSRKSTWERFHANAAMVTLAKITYMKTGIVTHAAMANLLALLAISARHVAGVNAAFQGRNSEQWRHLSSTSYQHAKEHWQSSLQTEFRGRGAAKYKDQLMAISAMLTFAIIFDRQDEARAYMIDSERLVRLRGLSKQIISRKARQLHHIYTWVRILGESSFVLHDHSKGGSKTGVNAIQKLGKTQDLNGLPASTHARLNHSLNLDDFLRLEPNPPEPDLEGVMEKEPEVSLLDIHLEDSRQPRETMYFQLYGVSETWLSLLSQTTRLANYVDSLKLNKTVQEAESPMSIDNRKQRLEDLICRFAAGTRGPKLSLNGEQTDNDSQSDVSAPNTCFVRALKSALVIFFYRRIRNVNPWILQPYVRDVVQALKDLTTSMDNRNIDCMGCPWPAFIAGSEAMSPSERNYISQWMDNAFHSTGFDRFLSLKSCLLEVWKRRDEPRNRKKSNGGNGDWNWVDICRENKLYMLLS